METENRKRRLYTIKQLAAEIGGTEWFWRTQIWDRRIPVVKVGRTQFVDIKDIDDFIETFKDYTSG